MAELVQQVTMKDPKKVEQVKRLAEHNRGKREELAEMKAQKSENETNLTYYGAATIVAIGVLGVIGYDVYQSKTHKDQPKQTPVNLSKRTPANEFDMD